MRAAEKQDDSPDDNIDIWSEVRIVTISEFYHASIGHGSETLANIF